MRLLIFTQYFWPESFPINDICKSLVDKGIEVEVLTGKPNYPKGKIFSGYSALGLTRERNFDAIVYRIPLVPRGSKALGLALNYVSFVFSGLIFAPWMIRNREFDVIFVYAPSPILQAIPALYLGYIKKCPVVIWVQDLWPESLAATGYISNKVILKLISKVVRFIYQRSDLILVQSEAFKAPVKILAGETPIKYHPNSVGSNFTLSSHGEIPQIPGLEDRFSVVFAGNIGQAQSMGVIIQAALLLKEHDEISFVVIGDGSARPWMLDEVKRLGLENLDLPGKFPHETMPGILRKASVLLVTLANKEIFSTTVPSKVQAYLAVGRPIIACLNGEGARLIEDAKAGVSSPAEDAPLLAKTILRLYHTPAKQLDEMGANGRKYYRMYFNHDELVDKLIDILASLLPKKGR